MVECRTGAVFKVLKKHIVARSCFFKLILYYLEMVGVFEDRIPDNYEKRSKRAEK